MKTAEEKREHELAMKKATYYYCKSKGICPVCRKEEAFYGHVLGRMCMEKRSAQKARRTANLTQEERDHINEVKRAKYHRYKAEGRCVNCGKPAVQGKTLCTVCDIQMRRASAAYRERSGRKKGWAEAGLCIRCGADPVEGRKLCSVCLEKNRESMAYARQFAPKERPKYIY